MNEFLLVAQISASPLASPADSVLGVCPVGGTSPLVVRVDTWMKPQGEADARVELFQGQPGATGKVLSVPSAGSVEVLIATPGTVKLAATSRVAPAVLRPWPDGSGGWWAAGDFANGARVVTWEATPATAAALASPDGWAITERAYVAIRLVNANPAWAAPGTENAEQWEVITRDFWHVRPLEWKGRRFALGSTNHFVGAATPITPGGASGVAVWLAPLPSPSAAPTPGPHHTLEGGRLLYSGATPAALVHDGHIVLSLRDYYESDHELRFYVTDDIDSWPSEPAFTGPEVGDGYDWRFVKDDLWLASADVLSGEVRVWVKPHLGDWQKVEVPKPHPPTSGLGKLWLLDGEAGPRVLYRVKDSHELVCLTLSP